MAEEIILSIPANCKWSWSCAAEKPGVKEDVLRKHNPGILKRWPCSADKRIAPLRSIRCLFAGTRVGNALGFDPYFIISAGPKPPSSVNKTNNDSGTQLKSTPDARVAASDARPSTTPDAGVAPKIDKIAFRPMVVPHGVTPELLKQLTTAINRTSKLNEKLKGFRTKTYRKLTDNADTIIKEAEAPKIKKSEALTKQILNKLESLQIKLNAAITKVEGNR